jgi:hypothetical protein
LGESDEQAFTATTGICDEISPRPWVRHECATVPVRSVR